MRVKDRALWYIVVVDVVVVVGEVAVVVEAVGCVDSYESPLRS